MDTAGTLFFTDINEFASIAWDFASTVVILARVVAALELALYELGLRGYFQRRTVKDWFHHKYIYYITNYKTSTTDTLKNIREDFEDLYTRLLILTTGGAPKILYSLHYQQLCGQISNAMQIELEYPKDSFLLPFLSIPIDSKNIDILMGNEDDSVEYIDARQKVNYYIDRNIDELQVILSKSWYNIDYILSFVLSIIVALILFGTLIVADIYDQGVSTLETIVFACATVFTVTLIAPVLGKLYLNFLERK